MADDYGDSADAAWACRERGGATYRRFLAAATDLEALAAYAADVHEAVESENDDPGEQLQDRLRLKDSQAECLRRMAKGASNGQ